jgi:hypothetical protein
VKVTSVGQSILIDGVLAMSTLDEQVEAVRLSINPAFGQWVGVDEGWYQIVVDCDRDLRYIDPNYSIQQIKEKFGTLRYYFQPSIPDVRVESIMEAIVDAAERKSEYTCERCGKADGTVSLRDGGWLKTLCDDCHNSGRK